MRNIKMVTSNISSLRKGAYHFESDTPCQDHLLISENEDLSIYVISDGAGSAKYADLASKCICEWSISFFQDNFNRLYNNDNDSYYDEILISSVSSLLNLNLPLNELLCTLVVLVIEKSGKWITVHIGDGFISKEYNKEIKIISKPENGDELCETYFVSQHCNKTHLRINKGKEENCCNFVLTSDGLGTLLYDAENNTIANALYKICGWMELPKEVAQDNLDKSIDNFFYFKTRDDISIIVVHFE